MSSFKRRQATAVIPGTRPSPYNSVSLLSTGLASLDDILGGGLPISSSLMIEADHPTSYAETVLKFWISQGLECGHKTLVISNNLEFNPPVSKSLPSVDMDDDEPAEEEKKDEKMKIAFRYEGMKQHQVSVPLTPAAPSNKTDVYCSRFDLLKKRALSTADTKNLICDSPASYAEMYSLIERTVDEGGYRFQPDASATSRPSKVLRIALFSLGSPAWPLMSSAELFTFLHSLRTLLRTSSATIMLTFSSFLYNQSIKTRLSHAVDSVIQLESFANSPESLEAFPRHNGLIKVPKLPSIGSLVSPSVKLSVLRGLGGGQGNNLGFRIKRRRFIIETVNGDPPIGAGEVKPKPKPVEEKQETKPDAQKKVPVKPKSVAADIHKRPELYEF